MPKPKPAPHSKDYDILIIGGGINGCGIARDAVGRGYSVYLCEANDLASGTSSQSTKLIHGGLRYLEHYEFRLVREALTEREVLWNVAPHIVHPMRFILPHHKGLRPAWFLRLGLFMYDYIGGRKKLPATKTIDLSTDETGKVLSQDFKKGFEYSDCAVDDARLVTLNALDAFERGASINTQSKCVDMQRTEGHWCVTIEDQLSKKKTSVNAKIIINASGPWADNVLETLHSTDHKKNIRLVQGSHIIVPKIYAHDRCYIFQNADDRIIFAIPYYDNFTLVGTTDHEYEGDPSDTKITPDEIQYLCDSANEYFIEKIKPDDIVGTFAGVRSLYNDGASKAQEATRDYVLRVDRPNPKVAPMINVFGGKITTYRRLAESMMERIEGLLEKNSDANKGKWTKTAPLPGGDFGIDEFDVVCNNLHIEYDFLTADEARRYSKLYGTRAKNILKEAKSYKDLGKSFSNSLYQAEVEYLIETEWARSADDILWRRTKLGLLFTTKEQDVLEQWLLKNSV
ncbi:MAG: glycerol-3-phosphate dehydrogenase [Cocleimonas sp.]